MTAASTVDRLRWHLRDATDADQPFLRTLYADTHGSDFDEAGLSAETQEMLVEHQFRVRERAYAAFPGVRSSIVEIDGRPVGRLLVGEDADGLHLVDIALLGPHRGSGTGTALLSGLIAEADDRRLPVSLHVELHSPARHLYDRLGFTPTAHDPFRVAMRREPLDPRHDPKLSPSAPPPRSTS